jgi:glycosidase
MNYMWMFPVADYFAPARHPIGTAAFKRRLDRLRRVYHPSVTPVLQNLLDSHDVGRFASMMENPDVKKLKWDDYFHVSRMHTNPDFIPTKPGPAAVSGLRLATIFQMTYPGAPMIYYGNEVGMWGANDPDNRQPMLWDDIAYEPETHTVAGVVAPQERKPDHALLAFFRQAIALRHRYRALRRGSFAWMQTRRARVLAFERRDGDECVRIWLNTGERPARVMLTQGGHDVWRDQPIAAGVCEIPARGWLVLI